MWTLYSCTDINQIKTCPPAFLQMLPLASTVLVRQCGDHRPTNKHGAEDLVWASGSLTCDNSRRLGAAGGAAPRNRENFAVLRPGQNSGFHEKFVKIPMHTSLRQDTHAHFPMGRQHPHHPRERSRSRSMATVHGPTASRAPYPGSTVPTTGCFTRCP